MTETVEGRWAPFAAALRDEFADELAGPLACCEPGADVMFEHHGPCSLMEGPEVIQVGAVGVTPADIMATDPEVAGSQWWDKELQFAAHGEIFELSLHGESLRIYTNGTRYRPEHEAVLDETEPCAVAAEIHALVKDWICPCPFLRSSQQMGYLGRPKQTMSPDTRWVWEWFPGWALCDDAMVDGWCLYSRDDYLAGHFMSLYDSAPANATLPTLRRLAEELTGEIVTKVSEAAPFVTTPPGPPKGRRAWIRVVHVHART